MRNMCSGYFQHAIVVLLYFSCVDLLLVRLLNGKIITKVSASQKSVHIVHTNSMHFSVQMSRRAIVKHYCASNGRQTRSTQHMNLHRRSHIQTQRSWWRRGFNQRVFVHSQNFSNRLRPMCGVLSLFLFTCQMEWTRIDAAASSSNDALVSSLFVVIGAPVVAQCDCSPILARQRHRANTLAYTRTHTRAQPQQTRRRTSANKQTPHVSSNSHAIRFGNKFSLSV